MGVSRRGQLPSAFFSPHSAGAEPLCSLAVSPGSPRQQGSSANPRPSAALALNHLPSILGTMAAVAAASAELLIIGWYIFRVLLQVFRYSLQKLAYTVSRTGRQVLGERRRAPN